MSGLFLVRIINKLLSLRGHMVFSVGKKDKHALVSYLLVPPFYYSSYFKSSHNNKIQSYLLVQVLRKLGYTVHLYSYLDEDIDTRIHYDLFIGHNVTFAMICKKLKPSVRKFLIAAGSDPNFGNQQQKLRIQDLNRRKNVKLRVYDDNIVPDLEDNYTIADKVLLIGNDFVRETYDIRFRHKIQLINNVTLHPYFGSAAGPRNNNFLFISSVGQVHRGLDLLLDIFPQMQSNLYVLSAFPDEPEFVGIFTNELFNTPNIHAIGYIDLDSPKFKSILHDVDFVILPSCSEGQSSSIINMITYGLIPVVPQNVGVPDIEKIGVEIITLDLPGVAAAVNKAINLNAEEFEKKKTLLRRSTEDYKPEAFKERLRELLT